jgi:hypothetical protein
MIKLTRRARLHQARRVTMPALSRENIPPPAGERPQVLPLRPREHLAEIRQQLREELGREPAPKEIRARFESQLLPIDLGQMLVDGVREILGPLPAKPPSRWRTLVQRLLHPWRAVPVARPGHRP